MNVTLANETISAAFDDALRLLVLEAGTQSSLPEATLFCAVDVGGERARVASVQRLAQGELVAHWQDPAGAECAELALSLQDAALRWVLRLRGSAAGARVYFPFLAALRAASETQEQERLWDGAAAFRDGLQRPVFRRVDWPLPLVRTAANGRTWTFLLDHSHEEIGSGARCWEPPGLRLRRTHGGARPGTEVLRAELIHHEGGWPAAFDQFRARVRRRVNFGEYLRPDLAWYRDQIVQHFTFLYGREILNSQTGRFELDRFLDEGEANFGGYDGFLLWGAYPRLGIDERTQWDFYDDFPGGRHALRQIARRARERGVRFFIPYLPWDRSAELHGRATAADHQQLARLVADVEADGVFLDTMSAVDDAMRAAIDEARPGVVFCSEGRARGRALEVITGSWDQSPVRDLVQGNWSAREETLPAVNLYRFLFPEHRLFVVNRHAQGAERVRAIQRGFFNGTGWVIWQDIFGLVHSYTPDEARLVKKCAAIFREHRRALWGARPTPLVETLAPGVYANAFAADGERLWTFYNENSSAVREPILQVDTGVNDRYVDVWNGLTLEPDGDGRLSFELAPQGVGAVAARPCAQGQEAR